MSKLIFILLLIFLQGCYVQKRQPKRFLYTLEQLATQKGKRSILPYNSIQDSAERIRIARDLSYSVEDTLIQTLIVIQTFTEYPNRYLVAQPENYSLTIADFFPKSDSIIEVGYVYGKYLGFMIDTVSNHKFLVLELPISCPFIVNGSDAISFSDVIVLYDMNGNSIFPIEVLDYRCSQANEYEKNAYQDICFCQKTSQQFLKFLQDYIQKLKEDQDIYPMKLEKITPTQK
jgi:hypothetical protein